jgi:hypothetical protein
MGEKQLGKKKKDGRDWKCYNAKLVNLGGFYLNPWFLDN